MIQGELEVYTHYRGKKGYLIRIKLYNNRKYLFIKTDLYQNQKKLKHTGQIKERQEKLDKQIDYCNNSRMDLNQAYEFIKNDSDPINNKDLEIFLLKKKLEELEKNNTIGILEFFDIRIQELKDQGKSLTAYQDTKNQISNFLLDEDISINNIDYEWLNKFVIFKQKYGKGNGNVPFLLKTLRALYKEAQRRESLNIKPDNPFLGLIKNTRIKDVPDFSVADIKKLFSYSPKKSTTTKSLFTSQRHIDIFLFQFAIGGHDYADIANLKWGNIRSGRVIFKRFKNRNKPNGGEKVDNLLNEFALNVLDKYGDRNSEKVFSHLPYPTNIDSYGNKRQNANQSLKRISDTLGFATALTSKTPRYLFRSFGGELLINDLILMQLQAHKKTGVTFNYQRKIPNEILDKEHKKILDSLFEEL
ncbi:phage integrase SAM-like domain-containing protein [Aquimarina gracilis]|uniref:Phage integrase SAM-like domain-containing protein n=1 Tax=Aquimarina gracilis TaxID=874422 RepID=A0ABU5ZWT7_9FLAO|nr:phage integrase SAM-like domain-containing protein [Aquimarina gracilis]MEB3346303.1 phage integrase SAM-like domain-containing protein [Aquimarina gracilis]